MSTIKRGGVPMTSEGQVPAEDDLARRVARLREQIKSYQRLAAQMDPDDLVAILVKLRVDLMDAEGKQRAAVVAATRPAVARLSAADDVAEGVDPAADPPLGGGRRLHSQEWYRLTPEQQAAVDRSLEGLRPMEEWEPWRVERLAKLLGLRPHGDTAPAAETTKRKATTK